MASRTMLAAIAAVAGCVPEGPATRSDAAPDASPSGRRLAHELKADPSLGEPFRDDFEREALGEGWRPLGTSWRLVSGALCAEGARNRGVWLRRRLPQNARIELTARSDSPDGDLKVELWGDGHSGARGASYRDATGYLAILGGWRNSLHVLARLDEHGDDRLAIVVEPDAQDPRARPVEPGRAYRFRFERRDGRRLAWWVDDQLYFEWEDPEPLAGPGHDHFGLNDWAAPVCFDDLRITPLP